MKEAKKANIPLRKIIGMCLILLFIMGIGVMASNAKVNNVKIILANGYEMNVVTTKTKVADILKENHIILLPEENSIPNDDKELSDNNTIRITKISDDGNQSQQEIADNKDDASNVTADSLLKSYDSIVEKIETVQETIPFETVTKDVSGGSDTKQDNVVQEGKDGLKEIKYKVKYQNNVEIERNEISSNVIQDPVNKIVEVRKQPVATSRSLTTSRDDAIQDDDTATSTQNLGTFRITAYAASIRSCGKTNGITASGTQATSGRTIAAPSRFPMGTKLKINGHIYTVEDRGGAIQGNVIDIYMNSDDEALSWGVKYLPVSMVN